MEERRGEESYHSVELTDVGLDMTAHPVAIIPLSLLPVGKSVSVVSCTASHYWAEVDGWVGGC